MRRPLLSTQLVQGRCAGWSIFNAGSCDLRSTLGASRRGRAVTKCEVRMTKYECRSANVEVRMPNDEVRTGGYEVRRARRDEVLHFSLRTSNFESLTIPSLQRCIPLILSMSV